MELAQNRGLTLCPIDGLSDSDDETPEDLALSTSLSIYLREDSFIDFVQRNSCETRVKSICFIFYANTTNILFTGMLFTKLS